MAVITKLTLNLPTAELSALRDLATRRVVSVTQALRQAIQTELFVQKLVDQGGTLLVQLPDGELQQLVFAQMSVGEPAPAGH